MCIRDRTCTGHCRKEQNTTSQHCTARTSLRCTHDYPLLLYRSWRGITPPNTVRRGSQAQFWVLIHENLTWYTERMWKHHFTPPTFPFCFLRGLSARESFRNIFFGTKTRVTPEDTKKQGGEQRLYLHIRPLHRVKISFKTSSNWSHSAVWFKLKS